ncbi:MULTISPECIES: hypothetical protein [Planktothrix]|uniref:hypothetical protein n=1 Tax=Planktothrix TaxID=54304 RepID=UPI0003FB0CF9|nr:MULTISPECIES: hypothetical protein [Planktothrix]CAD0232021.1 conserved hypothetical protein [Planktothrix agardhii]CAD5968640.1 hypothetical protein NO758_03615 [Planktothrix agardhii]
MNPDKIVENMEQKFSTLSAADLENLEVEELEQRLELAAIDYMAAFNFFAAVPVGNPCPKSKWPWGC